MNANQTPRIALCYGTRPQVIKAAVLRAELGQRWTVYAVDTGQHYDYALNELLYDQLGVSPPDVFLEVGSGSHADQTAAILTRCERFLRERRPAAVVVIGDTNSTLGSALAAVKLRIPVVHVEAGLRARDALMPEEINRRVVDAVASLLCAPSRATADVLRHERPAARVVETGDVTRDVLLAQEKRLPPLGQVVPGGSEPMTYAYCTLHRAELTDDVTLLKGVLAALGHLPIRVVLAMHPRTRAALGDVEDFRQFGPMLHVIPPVGYLESLALTRSAKVVVTDSGGVQREAYWLGVPCITLRDESEWVETVACGANRLLSPSAAETLAGVVLATVSQGDGAQDWNRDVYGAGDAAGRIREAVASFLDAQS